MADDGDLGCVFDLRIEEDAVIATTKAEAAQGRF
jgi:hypothetical protein